jgi:iron(III) transport system permease protein
VLVLAGTAAAITAPLLSLLVMALQADAALWGSLLASVLPVALVETALLLAGVAALCGTIGIATAWLVTAHRFPGRDWLAWLLPLPLAVPT